LQITNKSTIIICKISNIKEYKVDTNGVGEIMIMIINWNKWSIMRVYQMHHHAADGSRLQIRRRDEGRVML